MAKETAMPATENEWDKQEKAIKTRLQKLAKSTGSEIVKGMVKEDDPKVQENCRILNRLFHECLDEYESGEMKLEEAIDTFAELAKAI